MCEFLIRTERYKKYILGSEYGYTITNSTNEIVIVFYNEKEYKVHFLFNFSSDDGFIFRKSFTNMLFVKDCDPITKKYIKEFIIKNY
jgi:hypothetical protein